MLKRPSIWAILDHLRSHCFEKKISATRCWCNKTEPSFRSWGKICIYLESSGLNVLLSLLTLSVLLIVLQYLGAFSCGLHILQLAVDAFFFFYSMLVLFQACPAVVRKASACQTCVLTRDPWTTSPWVMHNSAVVCTSPVETSTAAG